GGVVRLGGRERLVGRAAAAHRGIVRVVDGDVVGGVPGPVVLDAAAVLVVIALSRERDRVAVLAGRGHVDLREVLVVRWPELGRGVQSDRAARRGAGALDGRGARRVVAGRAGRQCAQ